MLVLQAQFLIRDFFYFCLPEAVQIFGMTYKIHEACQSAYSVLDTLSCVLDKSSQAASESVSPRHTGVSFIITSSTIVTLIMISQFTSYIMHFLFSLLFVCFFLYQSQKGKAFFPIKTFIHLTAAVCVVNRCQSQNKSVFVTVWGLLTLSVWQACSQPDQKP